MPRPAGAARARDERETNDIIKSIRINSNCFVRRAIILSFWIYYGNSTVVTAANETEIIIIIIIIMAASTAVLRVLIRTNELSHIAQRRTHRSLAAATCVRFN